MTQADQVTLVDRGIELAPASLLTVEDFTYIDKGSKVALFEPPSALPVAVRTLTGLVALLEAGLDEVALDKILVHVKSHSEVSVVSTAADKWGRRRVFVTASLMEDGRKFTFDSFMGQEAFNIGLRSLFVPDSNVDGLLLTSGNLAAQSEARQEDDGQTQRVVVKQGMALVADKVVVPRVTLAPYRTFREAVQPPSDFIFRVKSAESGNQCALFEADGGYWRIAAMANVKDWLTNQLKATTELAAIPVIS